MERILVLGGSGQVGSALCAHLGDMANGLSRTQADLSKPHTLASVLSGFAPSVVINCAAYTNVEKAETEEDLATVINGEAPGVLAAWCAQHDVPLVHYSTDYVFSAGQAGPHLESDAVGPANAYGRSKLEGERRIREAGGRHLILRTSWVYDAVGSNFFRTMARLAATKPTLKIVDDQQGAPTYAPHLAIATTEALAHAVAQREFPGGVYHLCHQGITTWYRFALEIFDGLRRGGLTLALETAEPISTADYPSAVQRPLDSRLDTSKAHTKLGVRLPDWESGLRDCLEVYL